MQAQAFVRKWGPGGPAHVLNERAGAQAHFIDLCRVLGVAEHDDPDNYCFARGLANGKPTPSESVVDWLLRIHQWNAAAEHDDGRLPSPV